MLRTYLRDERTITSINGSRRQQFFNESARCFSLKVEPNADVPISTAQNFSLIPDPLVGSGRTMARSGLRWSTAMKVTFHHPTPGALTPVRVLVSRRTVQKQIDAKAECLVGTDPGSWIGRQATD